MGCVCVCVWQGVVGGDIRETENVWKKSERLDKEGLKQAE